MTQSAKPSEGAAVAKSGATPTGVEAAQVEAERSGSPGSTPSAAATPLKVGDPAPQVNLTLQNGKTLALSSLQGKQVAVYFYPKDDTPGCTVEAKGIRDQWQAFQRAGIQVYGVSMQDAASHTAFIEKHELPFDLAVDGDGSVTHAFGVPVSGGQRAARQTFLIGSDGNIKQIWRTVNPEQHAKELLEAAGAPATPTPSVAPQTG